MSALSRFKDWIFRETPSSEPPSESPVTMSHLTKYGAKHLVCQAPDSFFHRDVLKMTDLGGQIYFDASLKGRWVAVRLSPAPSGAYALFVDEDGDVLYWHDLGRTSEGDRIRIQGGEGDKYLDVFDASGLLPEREES